MKRDIDQHPAFAVSWVDRAQSSLAGAPFPWWLPLLVISGSLVLLEMVFLLISNSWTLSMSAPTGLMITYAAFPSYAFAFLYVLDRRAEAAVVQLSPLIKDSANPQALSFSIANMPHRPALFSAIFGLATFLILRAFSGITGDLVLAGTTEITRWIRLFEGVLLWIMIGVAVYHTVRQLRIIDHIYSQHVQKNLLNQTPLYGLASVSTYTAIGFAVPVSLVVLLILPRVPTDPISLGLLTAIFGMSVLTLISPVYRLHQELELEKARRQRVNAGSFDRLLRRVHEQAESFSTEQAAEVRSIFEVLGGERRIINSAPTWPWPPGAIRGILAALILPTVVWLIQQLLRYVFP